MNIKTYIAAAVVALTTACTQVEDVPVDETAATQVELNEDGTVATTETEGAAEVK